MMISYPNPLGAIIIGAAIASIILGLILRSYRGSISESSIVVRLGLVIILAIAVGVTIFSFFVMLSSHVIPIVLVIGSAVSVLVGIPIFLCQENKESNDSSIMS